MIMNEKNYVYTWQNFDLDTHICQYMDLGFFIQMLQQKKYFVNRKMNFADKCESQLPLMDMLQLQIVSSNQKCTTKTLTYDEISEIMRRFKDCNTLLTSCWTMQTSEDILMWNAYAGKYGVCIKTTARKFVNVLSYENYDLIAGEILYDGFLGKTNFLKLLFSKLPAYKNENEVRFYFDFKGEENDLDTGGVEFDVKPEALIDEVILSPNMNPVASKVLAEFLSTRYKIKVCPSKIDPAHRNNQRF